MTHHGDKPGEVTPASFRRFLVDTPLVAQGPGDLPPGACAWLGSGAGRLGVHGRRWLVAGAASSGPGAVAWRG